MFTLPRLTADEVGKESRVESHFRLPLTHAPSPSPSSFLSLSLSLLSRSVGRELRAAGTTIAAGNALRAAHSLRLCNFN